LVETSVMERVSIEVRRTRPDAPWTYAMKDRRQREVAASLDRAPGALLLSEVEPVVTIGRRTQDLDLLEGTAGLEARGIASLRVDRGGLATYHGPGQWVLFPVDRLERLTGDPRGVRKAVCTLLEIARSVAAEYEPSAKIREGAETGVWSKRGKLASVGIHIDRGVLLHGLAVNGLRTPQSFAGIRPCGLEPRVDFLLSDVSLDARDAEFERLGERLKAAALSAFWADFRPSDSCLDLNAARRYTTTSHFS
jgi:lipoate-protein ligase B